MPSMPSRETTRYLVGVAFAVLVFGCGFYALVPYPFELDDLVKGAMISLMTLSAQFVYGEALAHSVSRRNQQSYDAGQASSTTVAPEDATTTTTISMEPTGGTQG